MTIKQSIRIFFKSTFLALMIVGMSLVFIFIHDVLTQCDYFKAETITVEGGQRMTPDQILKTADIEEGVNLVSLNLKTVRKRLLAHPWIAEADIRRIFPGRVAIRIREQEPLAVLDFGKQFLINSDGVIFKEAQASEINGMPVMTGIEYSDWKTLETPGTLVFVSVLEILNIGRSSETILPNTLIKNINVDREIGLTLEMDGPVRMVKLGYGNYRKKYSRLEKIFHYIEQNENIEFIDKIDLRNPDHIVARPGNERLSEKDKKEV
ncbi:MAG: FtsQ-type POTRA domain-containing protein [Desulfobacteraceae bacterium]|nr:FtsQ-type POTRA domain-containing protein [Desulfobacteraceae bacterium]MBC2756038.1 FtsQ-type POTRA domain-containing protein [Desulfobacteraceae bacterium]